MRQHATRFSVLLAALFLLTTTILLWQSAFGSGIARRDAVHSAEQHRQKAVKLAKEAVDHSRQGRGDAFLTSAEAALQSAMKAGKSEQVDAAIAELTRAVEQGNAGHEDLARTYVEQAVRHLSEK